LKKKQMTDDRWKFQLFSGDVAAQLEMEEQKQFLSYFLLPEVLFFIARVKLSKVFKTLSIYYYLSPQITTL